MRGSEQLFQDWICMAILFWFGLWFVIISLKNDLYLYNKILIIVLINWIYVWAMIIYKLSYITGGHTASCCESATGSMTTWQQSLVFGILIHSGIS